MQVEVTSWEKDRNNRKSKINWQFTTSDTRIKLKRLYRNLQILDGTSVLLKFLDIADIC